MIDTHCHIDDPEYQSDFDRFIATQQSEGVQAILVPGVDLNSCRTVPEVCSRYPGYLYPALGLHPEEVRADYRDVLAQIHDVILETQNSSNPQDIVFSFHTPLVAIGEIGLDYHFSTEFKTEQQDALRIQLGWARELNLPVMIHARDAAADTLAILDEFPDIRGVMHCFSGSYEIASEYIRRGWYLGIGGVITFKNCHLADNLVPSDGRPAIPLNRILLETDAPYMAPVPHRGKPNESRFMSFVVDKLAATYSVPREEIIATTHASACSLFNLPK